MSGSMALQQGSVSVSTAHVTTGYSTQDSTVPAQHTRANSGGVGVSGQPRRHESRRVGPHGVGTGESVLPLASHHRQAEVMAPLLA